MSSPYAIRFLDDRKKEVFSGVFVHYDSDVFEDLKEILKINNKIIYFPIHVVYSDERKEAREKAAISRNISVEELNFVSGIEEYALVFTSLLFKERNIFGKHYRHSTDEFSAAENALSMIRLDSGYKDNVCCLYDISLPDTSEINLKTSLDIKVHTGVGKVLYDGSLKDLNIDNLKEPKLKF